MWIVVRPLGPPCGQAWNKLSTWYMDVPLSLLYLLLLLIQCVQKKYTEKLKFTIFAKLRFNYHY